MFFFGGYLLEWAQTQISTANIQIGRLATVDILRRFRDAAVAGQPRIVGPGAIKYPRIDTDFAHGRVRVGVERALQEIGRAHV